MFSHINLVKTKDNIYIMEFKIDKSAEAALAQIEDKQYATPFEADGRTIIIPELSPRKLIYNLINPIYISTNKSKFQELIKREEKHQYIK